MTRTSDEPTASKPVNTDAFWPYKKDAVPSVTSGLGNDILRLTTAMNAVPSEGYYAISATKHSVYGSSTPPPQSAPSPISKLYTKTCCAIHWWKPSHHPICL